MQSEGKQLSDKGGCEDDGGKRSGSLPLEGGLVDGMRLCE
jgi:hypothetical protein